MSIEMDGEFSGVAVLAVAAFSILLTGGLWAVDSGPTDNEMHAVTLQVEGAPVAIISPMPEVVWNGTQLQLVGSESYDADGTIVTYAWKVEHDGTFYDLFGDTPRFRFVEMGLYLIRLTVTDDDGKEGVDFSAVYAVLDSDLDGIPDWWEMKYLNGLSETDSDDSDGDGYSNLEEFAQGTDPLVPDPAEGLLERYWKIILIGAAVVAAAVAVTYPFRRRKKKETERRKMDLAIEIQSALDEE
jgi:hypothetical protein